MSKTIVVTLPSTKDLRDAVCSWGKDVRDSEHHFTASSTTVLSGLSSPLLELLQDRMRRVGGSRRFRRKTSRLFWMAAWLVLGTLRSSTPTQGTGHNFDAAERRSPRRVSTSFLGSLAVTNRMAAAPKRTRALPHWSTPAEDNGPRTTVTQKGVELPLGLCIVSTLASDPSSASRQLSLALTLATATPDSLFLHTALGGGRHTTSLNGNWHDPDLSLGTRRRSRSSGAHSNSSDRILCTRYASKKESGEEEECF